MQFQIKTYIDSAIKSTKDCEGNRTQKKRMEKQEKWKIEWKWKLCVEKKLWFIGEK